MKIKTADIGKVRAAITKAQGGRCPLCLHPIASLKTKKRPALDHDHATGYIRGVLCVNCNANEGRAFRAAKHSAGTGNDPLAWLERMVAYLILHKTPQWSTATRRGLIYPTHKTENDKRLAKLAKARRTRLAKKLLKGK